VVEGRVIVIDDYAYWQGCKKAVDEFFDQRDLSVSLMWIDDIGVHFRKSG
jgi:hypothetical protein